MRHIVSTFREWGFIDIHQTGISITQKGMDFLREIPMRLVDLEAPGATMGKFHQ